MLNKIVAQRCPVGPPEWMKQYLPELCALNNGAKLQPTTFPLRTDGSEISEEAKAIILRTDRNIRFLHGVQLKKGRTTTRGETYRGDAAQRIVDSAQTIIFGDLHGSDTAKSALCEFKLAQSYMMPGSQQLEYKLLGSGAPAIFMGDYYDRGQSDTFGLVKKHFNLSPHSFGLIGNHELERLKGNSGLATYTGKDGKSYKYTPAKISEQTTAIAELILQDRLQAAAVLADSILLTHAAFNPIALSRTIYELIEKHGEVLIENEKQLLELITEFENERLKNLATLYLEIQKTPDGPHKIKLNEQYRRLIRHAQFQAGCDRHGADLAVGGPYWTDAKVTLRTTEYLLAKKIMKKHTIYPIQLSALLKNPPLLKQICGHTVTIHTRTKHKYLGSISYPKAGLILTDGEMVSSKISGLVYGADGHFYSVVKHHFELIAVRLD